MIHFPTLIPPILQRLQPKRTLAEDFNVWCVSLSSTRHASIPARDKYSLATVALRIKKSKVTATSKPESAKPAKKVPKCLFPKQCLGKCMKKKLVGSRIHGMGSVFFIAEHLIFPSQHFDIVQQLQGVDVGKLTLELLEAGGKGEHLSLQGKCSISKKTPLTL